MSEISQNTNSNLRQHFLKNIIILGACFKIDSVNAMDSVHFLIYPD